MPLASASKSLCGDVGVEKSGRAAESSSVPQSSMSHAFNCTSRMARRLEKKRLEAGDGSIEHVRTYGSNLAGP